MRSLPVLALLLVFGTTWPQSVEASQRSAVLEFVRENPRQLEVYRRKVEGVAAEMDVPASLLADSPTLIAMEGLTLLASGRIDDARRASARLDAMAVTQGEMLVIPIQFDYAAVWPYSLKAPWPSAIVQGLALSLFTQLHVETQEPMYANRARHIAASFGVPLSQGGFTRIESDGLQFEEYPVSEPSRVLNGGALATLALADYARIFEDSAAKELVMRAGAWWQANIGRYDVTSPRFPGPVPAYSLAPSRQELLFRLTGSGPAVVDAIEWKFANGRRVALDVGGSNDANRNAESYVWANRRYQNWQDPRREGGAEVRDVVPRSGEYDHAPFSVALKEGDATGPLVMTIMFKGPRPDAFNVELLVDDTYRTIATLAPSKGDVSVDVSVGVDLVQRAAPSNRSSQPPVEPSYFSDNVTLVRLLAKEFSSKRLADFADRWAHSKTLTPVVYDPGAVASVFASTVDAPTIGIEPGEDSIHVEYPAVIERDGTLFLIYSAFGSDSRWRLKLATSLDDGKTWKRQGWLFAEGSLPFKGNYAFPSILFDNKSRDYLLVFSAAADAGQPYSHIYAARSSDLWRWSIPSAIVPEGGLRPVVWSTSNGFRMVYTIKDGLKSYSLVETDSADGRSWSGGRTVYALRGEPGERGFYTSTRFHDGGREFFILDAQPTVGRREWQLLCRDSQDRLVVAAERPLWLSGLTRGQWDDYRYGPTIATSRGETRVYFNGIPLLPDGNGQIGVAKFDASAILRLPLSSACK